jgi:hypothetical protein
MKREAPEFAARYAAGEFTTVAAAERAAKGVSGTLVKLRKAWERATAEDREIFRKEIAPPPPLPPRRRGRPVS